MRISLFLLTTVVLALGLGARSAHSQSLLQPEESVTLSSSQPASRDLPALQAASTATPVGSATVTPTATVTVTLTPAAGPPGPTSTPTPAPPPTATPLPTPTRTASPAPTSAPPLPTAQQLLSGMVSAIRRAGTFHMVLSATVSSSNRTLDVQHVTGDFSIRNNRLHAFREEVMTVRTQGRSKTTTTRQEVRQVGQFSATRPIGTGTWTCPRRPNAVYVPSPPHFANVSGKNVKAAARGGSTSVDGAAVWPVRVQTTNALQRPQRLPATLYIARRGYLLMRETISYTEVSGGVSSHLDGRADYSRYGERVDVRLPCD